MSVYFVISFNYNLDQFPVYAFTFPLKRHKIFYILKIYNIERIKSYAT